MTAQQFRCLSAYCSRAYADKQAVVLCRSFLPRGYVDTVKEKRGYLKIGFIWPRGIKWEGKESAFHGARLRNAPTMQDAANSKEDQTGKEKREKDMMQSECRVIRGTLFGPWFSAATRLSVSTAHERPARMVQPMSDGRA
jgi:hypothetical protein